MLTNQFKATVGIVIGAVIVAALGVNQVNLQKEVTSLKVTPTAVPVATATPTASPSATPTVTLRYTPKTYVPVTVHPTTAIK